MAVNVATDYIRGATIEQKRMAHSGRVGSDGTDIAPALRMEWFRSFINHALVVLESHGAGLVKVPGTMSKVEIVRIHANSQEKAMTTQEIYQNDFAMKKLFEFALADFQDAVEQYADDATR